MSLFQAFADGSTVTSGEHAPQSNSVFVERGNWPDTLAATREHFQATNAVMAVSDWYLSTAKYDSRVIDEPYPPETLHVTFDATVTMDGWEMVKRTEDDQFARYLSPGTTTYTYREFLCARDKTCLQATFAVNAGHLAVWHNGERLFAEESKDISEPLQKTVTLCFKKGKNRLLVKMAGARGANFKFSISAMSQLEKELIKHYGREAFLLCDAGYFKEYQRWLRESDTGDLLREATSALLSSVKGFPELECKLADLSEMSPDTHVAEWIEFYTTVARSGKSLTRHDRSGRRRLIQKPCGERCSIYTRRSPTTIPAITISISWRCSNPSCRKSSTAWCRGRKRPWNVTGRTSPSEERPCLPIR